jgi:hypothetical protein
MTDLSIDGGKIGPEEPDAAWRHAYMELEELVCDLSRMTRLGLLGAGDGEAKNLEMMFFALHEVNERAEKLKRRYYDQWSGADGEGDNDENDDDAEGV